MFLKHPIAAITTNLPQNLLYILRMMTDSVKEIQIALSVNPQTRNKKGQKNGFFLLSCMPHHPRQTLGSPKSSIVYDIRRHYSRLLKYLTDPGFFLKSGECGPDVVVVDPCIGRVWGHTPEKMNVTDVKRWSFVSHN